MALRSVDAGAPASAGIAAMPSVKIDGMYLELGVGAQTRSYLYVAIKGDLATRARSVNIVGRVYFLADIPVTIRPATLWVYAAGSEGSVEQIESMASLLADKVQVPHSEIKEAQRRVQTHAWINGSVALAMTQDIARSRARCTRW